MSVASAIFLLSCAYVIYVLFGYPLLLAMLSRRSAPAGKSAFVPRTVSVILPVWNGEAWIRRKLEWILQLEYPSGLVEVIVISDGSEDRTAEIVREFVGAGVVLLELPRGGKARALNAGIAKATGEILFFTDVRQELEKESLRRLVADFHDPQIGVVSGELVIHQGESQEEASVGLYWQYEKWIRRRLARIDSVLGATGCIYAMRRELAVPIPPQILLDDVYLPLAAFFRGYRVVFEPLAKAFDYPTALDTEFRRKVRTQAGVYQIIRAFPALLGPSNRMWIHFVSHKFGRLLLPFALIAAFVSGLFLAPPWATIVTAIQAGVYAIAIVDPLVPEGFPGKSISSAVRAFSVLMLAALVSAGILFVPRVTLWKQTRVGSAKPPSGE